jgi:hypothetical protein
MSTTPHCGKCTYVKTFIHTGSSPDNQNAWLQLSEKQADGSLYEAFAVTGFNKIFSANQPRQMNKRNRRFEDHLAKSHMVPHYQFAKMIQLRMNGKRRPSRDSNMTPPTSLLLASQCCNEWSREIWGTAGSGITSHPCWWRPRWSSKHRFLLFTWCGWLIIIMSVVPLGI